MKHRFRYLDEQGHQVEVADLATLREHARAGRLDDDTLLYDSLTDEWAPASQHSAYRLLDDPLADEEEGDGRPEHGVDGASETPAGEGTFSGRTEGEKPGGAEGGEGLPDVPTPGGGDFDFPDLDVTLAPDEVIESTDEVVQKLLREREREGGVDPLPSLMRGYRPGRDLVPPGEAEEAEDDPWKAERPPRRGPEPLDPEDQPVRSSGRARRRADAAATGSKPRGRRTPREPKGTRYRIEIPRSVVLLGGVLLVSAAVYGVSRAVNPSGSAQASTGGPESVEGATRTASSSPWTAAEGSAFRDMLEGVDSLREVYSVERIPSMWLAGPYLADADTFPEIREYWENYQRFVDGVRSQDTALFRRSFVDRMQEQGVSGSMVSIRLARALDTFRESQPARDTVYERMEDLAASALDLHELLADRSEDLVYDPVTAERASRQPILEAWSDDPYLRRSIWGLLDRITANLALLEYDAGWGRSDLTERLFQELRTRSVGADDPG